MGLKGFMTPKCLTVATTKWLFSSVQITLLKWRKKTCGCRNQGCRFLHEKTAQFWYWKLIPEMKFQLRRSLFFNSMHISPSAKSLSPCHIHLFLSSQGKAKDTAHLGQTRVLCALPVLSPVPCADSCRNNRSQSSPLPSPIVLANLEQKSIH